MIAIENDQIDKEIIVQRYMLQISNIAHSKYNKRDKKIMISRLKEAAQRVGILEEIEKKIKLESLIEKGK